MTALAIALALGALCGGMISVAHMLQRRDEAGVELAELRKVDIEALSEAMLNVGAALAVVGLAAADAVESFGRFAVEHERALRKRRT